MKQGTVLEVIEPFSFKPHFKGRAVVGKVGDKFVVTSPEYKNTEATKVDRKSKAKIGSGYMLENSDIKRYFKEVF